MLELLKSSRWW